MKKYFYLTAVISFILFSMNVKSQEKYIVRPNYEIEENMSSVNFVKKELFIKSFLNDNEFQLFFNKHKNDSYVYTSSLIKFMVKKNKILFKNFNNNYLPNKLLQNMLESNLKGEDFDNCKNCTIGSFFFYDAETYTFLSK